MFTVFSKFTPISTSLLPNAELDDIKIILNWFLPWNWNKRSEGDEVGKLENKFSRYFGVKQAIGFSSGRVGLYAILKSISIFSRPAPSAQHFEIILQAYTTIALPLAIKKAGFTPVYVDIDENTFNIDAAKIEEKITAKAKAIIVQHTFGVPAQMDKILEICKKHSLILIEDCAHSLGAEFGGKKVGTFGDAAFFSFGRDKIISSTSGGIVIANNDALAEKIKKIRDNLSFPPRKWVLRQFLHPVLFWCALPIYYLFSLGKIKIFFWQRLGLISRAYSQEEKKGATGNFIGYKFPDMLAMLALNQFKKLERFNDHRRKISEIYDKSFHYGNMYYHSEIKVPLIVSQSKPTFLYYTIQAERRDELLKFAAKKHIILGDWFPGALGPKGVNEEKFGYKKGDCPIAESVGVKSLNLPTNIKISEEDARKVVEAVKEFYK